MWGAKDSNMVTVLVNPIDVWLKIIDHDIHDLPIWGFIDKDGNVKAHMIIGQPEGGGIRLIVRGKCSAYECSAKWEPPDNEIEESLFSSLEQLIGKALNLHYRGEWNEDHT